MSAILGWMIGLRLIQPMSQTSCLFASSQYWGSELWLRFYYHWLLTGEFVDMSVQLRLFFEACGSECSLELSYSVVNGSALRVCMLGYRWYAAELEDVMTEIL